MNLFLRQTLITRALELSLNHLESKQRKRRCRTEVFRSRGKNTNTVKQSYIMEHDASVTFSLVHIHVMYRTITVFQANARRRVAL